MSYLVSSFLQKLTIFFKSFLIVIFDAKQNHSPHKSKQRNSKDKLIFLHALLDLITSLLNP